MPALLVDTTPRPASSSDPLATSAPSTKRSASVSVSPTRPPVSPITPPLSHAQLAPLEGSQAEPRILPPAPPPPPLPPPPPPRATFISQPPPVAISESDNPDAIALRSAISLLQLQREKSKRDLQTLQELKTVAVADPSAFARSLQAQRAQSGSSYHDVLTPTLSGLIDPAPSSDAQAGAELGATARKDSADVDAQLPPIQVPRIPQPQNIVRCPPIEWEKYHIVGEPLDKMHQEQKKWPGAVEPPRTKSGQRAPPHAVSAPYSPFTDGVATTPSTSRPPKNSKKST